MSKSKVLMNLNKECPGRSIKKYNRLLEDLHDLAVVAERRDEKPISLEEMKRRLKLDETVFIVDCE